MFGPHSALVLSLSAHPQLSQPDVGPTWSQPETNGTSLPSPKMEYPEMGTDSERKQRRSALSPEVRLFAVGREALCGRSRIKVRAKTCTSSAAGPLRMRAHKTANCKSRAMNTYTKMGEGWPDYVTQPTGSRGSVLVAQALCLCVFGQPTERSRCPESGIDSSGTEPARRSSQSEGGHSACAVSPHESGVPKWNCAPHARSVVAAACPE